eukprot:scaffold125610_cov18-Prasinocladus_malaysianus.AAC.1
MVAKHHGHSEFQTVQVLQDEPVMRPYQHWYVRSQTGALLLFNPVSSRTTVLVRPVPGALQHG